ncbi:two-component system sensor histidine kinase AlgZ [Tepidimonas ignava]|uniref:Sensor histidine kinase YehU n=1 Tax=Tepidimonas ignava TaxID=114249 RepID=A0A4R3LBJ5_9BURK|nr:histidine kinase [Tepidimonas ignava]TCS97102.1 two-component system sensor histidine kinase AlgZ [Tepidimonas ignava]TSE22336.1 Sensor histidine kinase YehU [Tepidimonas ignava]
MTTPARWPDLRSPAVLLRAAGVVAGVALALAWWAGQGVVDATLWAVPAWATLALAMPLTPWLQRRPYHLVLVLLALTGALLALAWALLVVRAGWVALAHPWRHVVAAWVALGAALGYLDWRHHRLAAAPVEARLQALQARMRPHFLFNSLNSVLALLRREPARAEALLEDLAELYRALLAEPRALVPLRDEVALARTYLAVEQVRLGARLRQAWHVDTAPLDALVPALTLQPLVENAIRHGVEPRPEGACVTVEAFRDDDHLVLFVRNPTPPPQATTRGHGLALANLRERLALLYQGRARLRTYASEGEFVAQVRLPLKPAPP